METYTQTHICKNCGNSFTGKYCNACGQKYASMDMTLKGLLRAWYDHIRSNTEIFLFTSREMVLRPGAVIEEYLAGKKKKYYNPFNYFLLIASAVTFLTITFSAFDPEAVAKGWEEIYEKMGVKYNEGLRNNNLMMMSWFQGHYNIVFMALIPFYAWASKIIFKKMGKTYGEHLIKVLYIFSVYSLFTCLVIPFIDLGNPNSMSMYISMIPMMLFIGWAFKDIYRFSYLKGLLLAIWFYILTQLLFIGATIVATLIGVIVSVAVVLAFKKLTS